MSKGWRTAELADSYLAGRDTPIPTRPRIEVAWLRAAGFDPADVYFKWAEAAVFGGLRPAQAQEAS